ncbi:hypothetical protein KKC32_02920 [Patescibacteria group bacterium]|nr:hypothetical protein [Patescibacteria group bacterium]
MAFTAEKRQDSKEQPVKAEAREKSTAEKMEDLKKSRGKIEKDFENMDADLEMMEEELESLGPETAENKKEMDAIKKGIELVEARQDKIEKRLAILREQEAALTGSAEEVVEEAPELKEEAPAEAVEEELVEAAKDTIELSEADIIEELPGEKTPAEEYSEIVDHWSGRMNAILQKYDIGDALDKLEPISDEQRKEIEKMNMEQLAGYAQKNLPGKISEEQMNNVSQLFNSAEYQEMVALGKRRDELKAGMEKKEESPEAADQEITAEALKEAAAEQGIDKEHEAKLEEMRKEDEAKKMKFEEGEAKLKEYQENISEKVNSLGESLSNTADEMIEIDEKLKQVSQVRASLAPLLKKFGFFTKTVVVEKIVDEKGEIQQGSFKLTKEQVQTMIENAEGLRASLPIRKEQLRGAINEIRRSVYPDKSVLTKEITDLSNKYGMNLNADLEARQITDNFNRADNDAMRRFKEYYKL